MAGIVDKSNQMQPQIHKINAIIERIGDSHSKQLLQFVESENGEKKNEMLRSNKFVTNSVFSGLTECIVPIPKST